MNITIKDLEKAFNDAREGKNIGGMGGPKEYTYPSFEKWLEPFLESKGFVIVDESSIDNFHEFMETKNSVVILAHKPKSESKPFEPDYFGELSNALKPEFPIISPFINDLKSGQESRRDRRKYKHNK